MKLLYQILFEVKVFHEYYLTDPDNSSVFQDAQQTDRLAWMDKRYKSDQPAGSDDLSFVLPPSMTAMFANRGLRLLESLSGFQVGVRVNPTTVGGAMAYTPAVTMGGDFNLIVLMQQQTGLFSRLTNSRMRRPIDALYYFSNADLGAPKTAPVLSRPISPQVPEFVYEQGELSLSGTNVELCYYNGATAAFETVPGNGFVNENDRLLVGRMFDYVFEATDNVTQAQFVLKDTSGTPVRAASFTGANALGTVTLNFDDDAAPALVTLPLARATDPILYSLEVTGTGGYSKTMSLIFYDNPSDLLNTWGVIQLQARVANVDMSLLDVNDNLYTPSLPAPEKTDSPFPVFEIRCKSRYTFWRYFSEDTTKILDAPTGTIAEFVGGATGVLTTLSPIPGTYLPFFFSQNPAATPPVFTYLPNPEPDTLVQVDGNQLISNIPVPASGIFPVSPAPT